MLRYPIQGFTVIVRLMRDQGISREQLQTHMFQRLMFHITETYFKMQQERGQQLTTASLEKMLRRNPAESTPTSPGTKDFDLVTTVPLDVLLSFEFLDWETLTDFRTMDDFVEVEKRTGPAIAVYLYGMVESGISCPSPTDLFNEFKVDRSMKKIILRPFGISEGLSADMILEMQKARR